MTRYGLIEQITNKKNYLCVGLDTDITKVPLHLRHLPDAVFLFNKAIIDATREHCVAYKLNTAFYEAMGLPGWVALQQTVDYIGKDHFTIADAKRGDIGNTASQYAETFFNTYGFDAVTVTPYMGEDSVRPFLNFADKTTIVLGLTSNPGANDFEQLTVLNGAESSPLYEVVMQKVAAWGNVNNLMFVTGATRVAQLAALRQKFPEHFFLVPGVGAQGGSLSEVSTAALTASGGILVNASRAIIYAGSGEDFAEKAAEVAKSYAAEMEGLLNRVL